MLTELTVPLDLVLVLLVLAASVGMLANRRGVLSGPLTAAAQLRRRRDDPPALFFSRTALEQAIELTVRRSLARPLAHTVLRARIDQLDPLDAVWTPETRDQMLGKIAAVMRAGVRRGDRVTHIAGEGFTIVIPGSDERSARSVAERLRAALASTRIDGQGIAAPLTARFGLAARRAGEGETLLAARAERALRRAEGSRDTHLVAASEIEEVLYLPAPQPSPEPAPAPSAAAA